MDKLARPLLILHGAESQIYPGEVHFFPRDIVPRDTWTRIEDFFERTVKN